MEARPGAALIGYREPMPRFEDGDKFWEVTLAGTAVHLRSGRIGTEYEVFVRLPDLENGCSCPSGKRPCKHAIALAVLVSHGGEFVERTVPAGFYGRAQSGRYYAGGE